MAEWPARRVESALRATEMTGRRVMRRFCVIGHTYMHSLMARRARSRVSWLLGRDRVYGRQAVSMKNVLRGPNRCRNGIRSRSRRDENLTKGR
jgi:hypothetical protein